MLLLLSLPGSDLAVAVQQRPLPHYIHYPLRTLYFGFTLEMIREHDFYQNEQGTHICKHVFYVFKVPIILMSVGIMLLLKPICKTGILSRMSSRCNCAHLIIKISL